MKLPDITRIRKTYITPRTQRANRFIQDKPLISVFGLFGLLFLLVLLSQFIQRPTQEAAKPAPEPTLIETYTFGESPKMTMTAKVEKSGVINVYAQSAGIVQKINVTEGKEVGRGQSVVSLSTTPAGGNVSSLSRQIAQKSFEFNRDNFDLQKDMIGKQRDLANKGETQGAELREIGRKSLDETRTLISMTEEIFNTLEDQIEFLESTNVNGSNDAAILGAKQGKAGALASLSQLRSGLRTAEYQTSEDQEPAEMGRTSRDLTIKQLELQEKSMVLTRDISELNYKLARVSESMMYPSSPCPGVVERVHVKVGQSVAPGTLIATIKAEAGENTAIVLVPRDTAKQITLSEPSEFQVGQRRVMVYPRYISTEATDGTLYSILYSIPAQYGLNLTNGTSIPVSVSIGSSKVVDDNLFIPLDSVYQTQDKAYVYIVKKDGEKTLADSVDVGLGEVQGRFVRVNSGITSSDSVIVSRSVQEGEEVRME